MAVNREILTRRHKAVRAEKERLDQLRMYSYEYKLKLLAEMFYYSEGRIIQILAMNDNDPIYTNPNQTQLFEDENLQD